MLTTSGCTEEELNELFGIETDDDSDDSGNSGGGSLGNAAYEYTYKCPVSGSKTVTISAGTAKCQKAQEYFARVYSCNDVDNFNTANCRVCNDCESQDWKNYCSLCN